MKGTVKSGHLPTILFGNGAVGVPLFFIISGFIMFITTRNLSSNWRDITAFIGKRIWRIAPLYYLATLAYLVVYSNFTRFVIEHPNWLLPTLLFYPSYGSLIGPAYGFPALAVGWSLNYEVYFYLLIALCTLAGKWRWHLLLTIFIASVFIVPLITNGYVMQSLRQWYTYKQPYFSLMTNPILLFFAAGIVLGKLYITDLKIGHIGFLNALVLIASINFALAYVGIIQQLHGYWHHFFNCTFLLLAFLWRNKCKPFKIPRVLVWLGNSSFSIYLVHSIVIGILPISYVYLNLPFRVEGWAYFAQLLTGILLLSTLCYRYIEKPMGGLASKLFNTR